MAGGNAADAAVAVAAALNLTEPTSTGLGGDMFALYYDASTGEVSALNGSGRAPAALSLEVIRQSGLGEGLPPFHPFTITVPGACAGWCDLIERFGSLPMAVSLAPAIDLAEEGFAVAPLTAYFWGRGADRQLKSAPGGSQLLIDGRAPRAGEIMRNPGLAKTLRIIAEHGKSGYYEGEIAEKIVKVIQSAGGVMAAQDLADHGSTWETPISAVYKGIRVYECPPNGQGLVTLLAFNILNELNLDGVPTVEEYHLLIEALRLAFADGGWYIADPEFAPAPLAELLGASYSRTRAARINPSKATLDQPYGHPISGSDTVYFSVVDGEGNACSFINSNYMGFGTGIVPDGTGFSLQNRGHNFSLDPDHPNCIQPAKRPYHTIIPAMATHEDDGSLFASFGVMGGFMQPQGHVQVMLNMLNHQMDPQQALDRPRLCLDEGLPSGRVLVEEGIAPDVQRQLSARGHVIQPVAGMERAVFGRGQIILRDRNSGVLCGGSDPRADGVALGF
jgi:gamma-glutamyltranspeptidase/glutathione hydrolase